MTPEEICKMMAEAERKAGELMMNAREICAENKTDSRNVVTKYDRAVQEMLRDIFTEAVPGAKFFCEESDEQESVLTGEGFIIDPIDGTMNFVRGFGHSCISSAYIRDGEILAGAIYNPYLDELFTAVRGQGSFCNGRLIRATDVFLAESVVCFGTAPYATRFSEKTFRAAGRIFDASLDLRREGAAALDLCSVASGRAGAFFEYDSSLWDYAAGSLIVEEAGGICCDLQGRPLPKTGVKTTILAGTPRTVQECIELLKDI